MFVKENPDRKKKNLRKLEYILIKFQKKVSKLPRFFGILFNFSSYPIAGKNVITDKYDISQTLTNTILTKVAETNLIK